MVVAVLEEMKTCSKCRIEKAVTGFHRKVASPDGLRSWCKSCDRGYQQEYGRTEQGKNVQNKANKKHRQTFRGCLGDRLCSMNQRCSDPRCPNYKYYGAKGVQCLFISLDELVDCVISLGFHSYDQIKGLDIDRINNYGHYGPGNIRLVTPKVNQNNKRKRK